MEITKKLAREFLEDISSEDKVVIIHDDDLDGFSSAILLYDFCKQKNATVKHFVFKRGRMKISDFELDDSNKIIITDLAPSFLEGIDELNDKEILYIDHHPKDAEIPDGVLELRTESKFHCGKTAYDLINDKTSSEKQWVLLLSLLADMGYLHSEHLELIYPLLKKYSITLEEAKEISYEFGRFLSYFYEDLDKAFEELLKINSFDELKSISRYTKPVKEEIEKHIEDYKTKKEKINEINYFYFEPKFFVKSTVTTILSQENKDEIYVFAVPQDEKIGVSARNQSKRVNMAELMKAGIKGLGGAIAGGHAVAAGATIQKRDLEKFKENLRDYLKTINLNHKN